MILLDTKNTPILFHDDDLIPNYYILWVNPTDVDLVKSIIRKFTSIRELIEILQDKDIPYTVLRIEELTHLDSFKVN